MDWARYAIYWLPDGALGKAGADWLGWDARSGRGDADGAPARYGFHATIKPPFRLAHGVSAEALCDEARAVTAELDAVDLGRLTVTRLGRFLALTPACNPSALAAKTVAGLDAFRAPPGAEERERRRAASLTPAQETLLDLWGYPYVMDEFRMHLTLTGRDPDAEAEVRAREVFGPLAGPHRIEILSLMGEDEAGRFHLVEDLPLGAHAGAV
jgi:hypothetical protein